MLCSPRLLCMQPGRVARASKAAVVCGRHNAQHLLWQRRQSAASSGEAETSTQAGVVDVTASAAEPTSSSDEEQADAVASHPLPDMFGAQELITELQDQESFGKRGEGWAFAELAALLLLLIPPFTLTGLVDILATLLITAGLVFMVYGLLSLGRYVSPLPVPRKNHQLVTTGMYSYLRHPQYGGLLMAAFGIAIITRSETRLALAAVLWFVLHQKVKIEEKSLMDRYGQVYADYKARVKRFFPYVY